MTVTVHAPLLFYALTPALSRWERGIKVGA
jgi:hypothetical protein